MGEKTARTIEKIKKRVSEVSNFWLNKKVLVTGATGLLGSWLVKSLIDKKANVVALIRDFDPQSQLIKEKIFKKVSIVNGSLENFQSLQRALFENYIEYVFHLGAQPLVDIAYLSPLQTFEANIRGTYNLLEAARNSKLIKGVIVASSDKAYGEAKKLPYTEDMPLKGIFPYEVSKSCADLLANSYFQTYGVPIAISRCGNIYGGGDLNWSRIIPGTIKSLLENESPIIRSNGLFLRDYIYVEDVVNAYLLLGEKMQTKGVTGQAFNFAPGKPYSVLDIVKSIQKIMKKEKLKPKILDIAKGEIKDQFLDSSKSKKLLNWQSQFQIEEGLKKTIKWYESYLNV